MTNGETNQPAPKAPVPKQGGRIATLEQQVALLRTQMDEVRWCQAELMFRLKSAAAKQVLSQPAIQERLQALIMAQMDADQGII